jgi:hypothetical protein
MEAEWFAHRVYCFRCSTLLPSAAWRGSILTGPRRNCKRYRTVSHVMLAIIGHLPMRLVACQDGVCTCGSLSAGGVYSCTGVHTSTFRSTLRLGRDIDRPIPEWYYLPWQVTNAIRAPERSESGFWSTSGAEL